MAHNFSVIDACESVSGWSSSNHFTAPVLAAAGQSGNCVSSDFHRVVAEPYGTYIATLFPHGGTVVFAGKPYNALRYWDMSFYMPPTRGGEGAPISIASYVTITGDGGSVTFAYWEEYWWDPFWFYSILNQVMLVNGVVVDEKHWRADWSYYGQPPYSPNGPYWWHRVSCVDGTIVWTIRANDLSWPSTGVLTGSQPMSTFTGYEGRVSGLLGFYDMDITLVFGDIPPACTSSDLFKTFTTPIGLVGVTYIKYYIKTDLLNTWYTKGDVITWLQVEGEAPIEISTVERTTPLAWTEVTYYLDSVAWPVARRRAGIRCFGIQVINDSNLRHNPARTFYIDKLRFFKSMYSAGDAQIFNM